MTADAEKVARLEVRRVRMGSNTFALDLIDGRSVEFAGRPDTETLAWKLAESLFSMQRVFLDAEAIDRLVAEGGQITAVAPLLAAMPQSGGSCATKDKT